MRFPTFAFLAVACTAVAAEKPLDESNSWPLAVPDDDFGNGALLDLRDLNETQSGQSGFIRLSEDGNSFVRGDGEPIRFWAVGAGIGKMAPEEIDRQAKWLAKLGVNLARLHVTVVDRNGETILDLNEEVIDKCYRFIKAAKDAGIYVIISPYYAHFEFPERWGIDGGRQNAVGTIFVNETVQEAYRYWTREFYTRTNPYTGIPIKDDPTVAILQIHNEDSLFFWTQAKIAEPHKLKLAEHFGSWLEKKHGSIPAAFQSWGEKVRPHEHDAPDQGRAGIFDVYFLTQDVKGSFAARLRDQSQFMAEFQRAFYDKMGRYLREDLGCRQLLNATNWRTANDRKLKALERYTYHALEIDAENEYVGSDYQHKGEHDHYRVDPGHYLVNESVLPKPFELSTNWKMAEGHPFIATETAWKNPNRYQSEGPFLIAAYQSLNGVDAICWFACVTPGYEEDPLKRFWRHGDQFSTHKWNHCYPAMMAGFPANALLFRRGYLQQADPVVREVRDFESIWNREEPRIADNETYGDQRDPAELQPGWEPQGDEINRAAFLIGPVMSSQGGDPAETFVADLSPFIDLKDGVITSATNELVWRYRDEICTMNAPKAQGVTGFLKRNGGRFELQDVVIESENDYATVNVVPLDDQPIASSGKVLIQVVTVNRLTGWETVDATFSLGKGENSKQIEGEQIVKTGRPPFRIANTLVSVTVDNPALEQLTILDINGYPVRTEDVENGRVTLPKDCIYAVLHSP